MNNITFNLMIAGVGGQGTVLASRLIAAAAIKKGFDIRTTETIGMAQRGGCVFGHVRIGENIYSPLIPSGNADALIAFEPAEAVRQLSYLKKDGTLLVCDNAIKPITDSGIAGSSYEASTMIEYLKKNTGKLIIVEGKKLENYNAKTFNIKTLNVMLLGAAAQSGIFPFDAQSILDIMPEVLPQRFLEMNLNAFETGKGVVS